MTSDDDRDNVWWPLSLPPNRPLEPFVPPVPQEQIDPKVVDDLRRALAECERERDADQQRWEELRRDDQRDWEEQRERDWALFEESHRQLHVGILVLSSCLIVAIAVIGVLLA